MVGRREHTEYNRLGFVKKRNAKGNNVAFCNMCRKELGNTAVKRLESHRRTCHVKGNEGRTCKNNQKRNAENDICLDSSVSSCSMSMESLNSTSVSEVTESVSVPTLNDNCKINNNTKKSNSWTKSTTISKKVKLKSSLDHTDASDEIVISTLQNTDDNWSIGSKMAPTIIKKRTGHEPKGPGGRPKHEVWTLGFRRVLKHCDKTQRTVHAAFCIMCNKVLCNTASKRLAAHRRICTLDSPDVSQTLDKSDSDMKMKDLTKMLSTDSSATVTFVDMDETAPFVSDVSTSEITTAEYTFLDSADSLDDFKFQNKASMLTDLKLETCLAKFFIGCNIPFSVAESSYFKKLCLVLNPNAKLITSEQLSGPLLDNIYSKFHKDIKVGPASVLLIDGWKNENNNTKNLTVMMKTESNETIFLDNYELSSSIDIVTELTDITKNSIAEAYEQFKTEVYAVILGNSCSLLKMDDLNDVWQFPCNLHILKLLTKEYVSQDFMNTLCKILKQLNCVFKDDELENKINSEQRWLNSKCILEYCIANIGTIQAVLSAENTVKLSKDYKSLFFDEEFIRKIENFSNFLESISELTTTIQMRKSNIADTAEQWLSLQITEEDPELADRLQARRESVMNIQCLVANYLHPVYRGRRLTDDQMNKVEEFLLNELDAEGLNSLQSYVNEESIFRVLNQKGGLSAQTYWSLARRTHSDLATLALKLLTIPAAISTSYSQICSMIKNSSLKPDRMRKLIAMYYHLKEKEEKEE